MKLRTLRDTQSCELVRFVFYGEEKISGSEKAFFVELALTNPGLSPVVPILGYKTRMKLKEADISDVLAGSAAASGVGKEKLVTPSFIVVRAGVFGASSKQIAKYTSATKVLTSGKNFYLKADECLFALDALVGKIFLKPEELDAHPEYLCDAGSVSWNLKYRFLHVFAKGFKGKQNTWFVPGGRVEFTGSFIINGEEYTVNSLKYPGYIEHFWGRDYNPDWYHISSTSLISVISGHTLKASNFAIHGIFMERASLLFNLEGKQIFFISNMGKGAYTSLSDVVESPDNSNKERLHWSVSFHSKQYVIDVDLFSNCEDLCMRPWETSEGQHKVLKVLSGAAGLGEIRLYKRVKKNLILIEQARLTKTLCEYGKVENNID